MFKDKVVIITGGSSGIGEETAYMFAEAGAKVVITYKRNKKGAEKVLKQIKSLGVECLLIQADLSKDINAKKVVQKVFKKFKKIDVLINNAGRYINGDEWDKSEKTWINSLKQNLVSVLSMSKYASMIFEKQKSGVIVNVASIMGVEGNVDSITYGAGKAGVINATKAYSKLLQNFGGRANCVSPHSVMTGYWLTAPKEELLEKVAKKKNGRLLEVNEVAEKIFYLASDEAKSINGQNIIIE